MDFPVKAEELIPQGKPIVLVDRLLECNETKAISDFVVRDDGVFVEDGLLASAGILENIAQTCALRIGCLNSDQPVRIGVIGAVKNFAVNRLPKIGEVLTTTVQDILYFGTALVVSAETRIGDESVAVCEMKVFLVENGE